MADKLSRKQMEKVIAGGGSVMVEGRVISKVGDLPPESELAKGDAQRSEEYRQTLIARRDEIEAELARLDAGGTEAPVAPAGSQQPQGGEGKVGPDGQVVKNQDDKSGENDEDLLPDDFPAKKELNDEGFATVADIEGLSDEELDAIKGINGPTITKIRAAITAIRAPKE